MRVFLRWFLLAAATAVAAVALDRIGLPSSALFAALLVGLVAALTFRYMPSVSTNLFRVAQAVTGVSLGVYVQSSSLNAVADAWLPVALVSGGTLVLSLLCGWALVRTVGLDTPTASLGMINDRAKSQIPGLGYTVTYAVGNTLLTVWGMVIVLLIT